MPAAALLRSGPARAALVAGGLAALVAARWAATRSPALDPVGLGLAFGAGLLALALAGGLRPALPRPATVPLGLAAGLVLVALALVVRPGPLVAGVAGSFPFGPWAAATLLVALGEETVVRGVLFDALDRLAGPAVAVALTGIAFALVHVPLSGWQALPLDLGVGLWLGGLRLLSGGIGAPALAHAVADLATYWL